MTPTEIKKLRATLNMTQEEFAQTIRVNRVTVARWETGESEPRGLYQDALADLIARSRKRTLRGEVKLTFHAAAEKVARAKGKSKK